jgi:hypothetical protein
MAQISTSTYRGSHAQFSASSRPVPAHLMRSRAPAAERIASLPAATAARMRVTAVVLALLALVALVAGSPQTVTVPLAVVFLTGLAVSGGVAAAERRRGIGADHVSEARRPFTHIDGGSA